MGIDRRSLLVAAGRGIVIAGGILCRRGIALSGVIGLGGVVGLRGVVGLGIPLVAWAVAVVTVSPRLGVASGLVATEGVFAPVFQCRLALLMEIVKPLDGLLAPHLRRQRPWPLPCHRVRPCRPLLTAVKVLALAAHPLLLLLLLLLPPHPLLLLLPLPPHPLLLLARGAHLRLRTWTEQGLALQARRRLHSLRLRLGRRLVRHGRLSRSQQHRDRDHNEPDRRPQPSADHSALPSLQATRRYGTTLGSKLQWRSGLARRRGRSPASTICSRVW